jgi:hypothetical protein
MCSSSSSSRSRGRFDLKEPDQKPDDKWKICEAGTKRIGERSSVVVAHTQEKTNQNCSSSTTKMEKQEAREKSKKTSVDKPSEIEVKGRDDSQQQEDTKPRAIVLPPPAAFSQDEDDNTSSGESLDGMEQGEEEQNNKGIVFASADGDSLLSGSISESAKKEKRLAMNRMSARARRKRKKVLLEALSSQVTDLRRLLQEKESVIAQLRSRNEQLEEALRQVATATSGNAAGGLQQGNLTMSLQPQQEQPPSLSMLPRVQQFLEQLKGGSPESASAAAGGLSISTNKSQHEDALRLLLQAVNPSLNASASGINAAAMAASLPSQTGSDLQQSQLLNQLLAARAGVSQSAQPQLGQHHALGGLLAMLQHHQHEQRQALPQHVQAFTSLLGGIGNQPQPQQQPFPQTTLSGDPSAQQVAALLSQHSSSMSPVSLEMPQWGNGMLAPLSHV